MKLEFSRQVFEKILKYEIVMKIRPVGASSFHAVGPTDMTKPAVAYRNFTNAPKKECLQATVWTTPKSFIYMSLLVTPCCQESQRWGGKTIWN